MAGRCKREGSSSETSLVLGLKETTVLEKGWKATSAAPSSGDPVLTGPVSSEKTDIERTDSLWGSMKVIWLEVAFGSDYLHRSPERICPLDVGLFPADRSGEDRK